MSLIREMFEPVLAHLVPLPRRAPNPRPMFEVPRVLGMLDEVLSDV